MSASPRLCSALIPTCTATANLGHSRNQDCGIITVYLKGVSETLPLGVGVFDTYGVSKTKLVLTLPNCGLNNGGTSAANTSPDR